MPDDSGNSGRWGPRLLNGLAIAVYLAFCVLIVRVTAPPPNDLKAILARGQITVLTRNNAHCYYIYRDQAMGFEYELAREFARSLGVALNLRVAERWERMIPDLLTGRGDLIAASFTITPRRRRQVAFSNGYLAIQQHIIVHRGNREVRRVEDLAGRTVDLRAGTSYQERLEHLQEQGLMVNLRLHEDLPTEELIRMVAERQIEITVADSNIALLNRRYHPQAIVAGTVSNKEHLGWAVRPGSRRLLERINRFWDEIRADGRLNEIYNRYFAGVETFDFVDLRTFHRRVRSRLPRYAEAIRRAADRSGLDWRLIAAQMYQESHYNPWAQSHAGAHGLMQITEETAASLEVADIFDPLENIRAGVEHLKNLYDHFDRAVGRDRLYIALAAYNVGQGHILDARNLARTLHLDPNRWGSLEQTLPKLKYRRYYKDSIYGYCRGDEPVDYIRRIKIYHDILRNQDIRAREFSQRPGNPVARP